MATLQELFGANATENSTQIIVNKADLQAVGLDQNLNNLNCIVAAIIWLAYQHYRGVTLGDDYLGLYVNCLVFLEPNNLRQFRFLVKFYTSV